MLLQRPTRTKPRAFDPELLGTWSHAEGAFVIDAEGWVLPLDQYDATISLDGQALTVLTTVYSRTLGSGPAILGAWQLVLVEDGATLVEDWYFRADGTYTSQWTKNGAFDAIAFGHYSFGSDILSTKERRAVITTGPGYTINFQVPFGDDYAGTYGLPSANTLVWTLGAGGTQTFTRA